MAKRPSNLELEGYLRGELSAAQRRRVEAALDASAELRARLAALRDECATIEAVKDSFAIRLPEKEEERIASKVLGELGTRLTAR